MSYLCTQLTKMNSSIKKSAISVSSPGLMISESSVHELPMHT